MKYFPHTCLTLLILLTGCSSIPEPTVINIASYQPETSFPLSEYIVPLSDQEAWNSEGWEEASENGFPMWTTTSGTAKSLRSHSNLELHLEMKLSPGSSLEIRLQNVYPLTIHADASTEGHGYISGIAPSHPTGKKEGLWQTLHIEFSAPINNEIVQFPARIIRASLNGIPIHEQITLPSTNTEGYGRLMLQATGVVSIRKIGLKNEDNNISGNSNAVQALIPASNVNYTYFEKDGWSSVAQFEGLTPLSSGSSDLIDIAGHSNRQSDYGLIYTGTFTVPSTGKYVFLLTSDDGSSLSIDENQYLLNDGFHGPETVTDTVTLETGVHEATIHFFQGGGGASLKLEYTAEGLGTIPLFSPKEGEVNTTDSTYLLNPESGPIVQRGFLIYPPFQELSRGESPTRVTHGVSVGDPAGNNFAVDAGRGTLLMLWHGKFANMANMWEGRGEWQNISPLGDLVARNGKPDFAILPNTASLWPDSIIESNSIIPKGYSLDEQGWPTFEYKLGQATLEDEYQSNSDGLLRTASISDNDTPIYQLIASGSDIENLGKGNYAVQGPGYLVQIKECKNCELLLRHTATGQELIASIAPGGGRISSAFSW